MSVVMGVRTGTTELTALADGYRTSSEAWAGPLRPRRHPGPEGRLQRFGVPDSARVVGRIA